MKSHRNHKLSTSKSVSFPSDMFFLDTETTTIQEWETRHRPELIFGHCRFVHLEENNTVSETDSIDFRTLDIFWTWFTDKIADIKESWVFAHNWSYDFPMINGFEYLFSVGYKLSTIVIESPPVILIFTKGKSKIRFIDTLNYFRQSLRSLGDVIGHKKGEVNFNNRYSNKLASYCRDDVIILEKTILGLITYLYDNQYSKLTSTLASLSFSIYVRNFMPRDIFINNNHKGVSFARKSYFGGRTEAFYIGRVRKKLYLIDVNSQYPSVMKNNKYPYNIKIATSQVKLEQLPKLLEQFSLTCLVNIETDIPAYPVKLNDRTVFPVGSFTAYLSTPEIKYALERNHIKSLFYTVIYEHDYLFKDFVDTFYEQRKIHKKQGNMVWSMFDKILMNSLYGKFGQANDKYIKTSIPPEGRPRIEKILIYETGKWINILELNDTVYMATEKDEATDAFVAIAAHVTAYGRMMIQSAIDLVGKDHIYYCDTDSVLVDKFGLDKMQENLSDNELGMWSIDGEYNDIHIHGAKDYRFGHKIKIKGINKNATQLGPRRYDTIQFAGLKGVIRTNDLSHPLIKRVEKKLSRKYTKGQLLEDGVIEPFRLVNGVLPS